MNKTELVVRIHADLSAEEIRQVLEQAKDHVSLLLQGVGREKLFSDGRYCGFMDLTP